MQLEREDMALLDSACADPGNLPAQELLNVFAVQTAVQVLEALPTAPVVLFADIAAHIQGALDEARRRKRFAASFAIRAVSTS